MRSPLLSLLAAVSLFFKHACPGQAPNGSPAPGQTFEALRSKAEAGDEQAITELASRCLRGDLSKLDGDAAISVLIKAASGEHVAAMFALGALFESSAFVARDEKAAHAWYTRAAELGHAEAMYNLGLHHESGLVGATMDPRRAASWWRRAAELGHAKSMAALGQCYAIGKGVPKDYGAYVDWHRKAAELGDTAAMHTLGASYLTGLWVQRDEKAALGWYQKAADVGDATAMRILATEFYWQGRGTEQNTQQALIWLKMSASLGNSYAMAWLGKVYERGVDVPRDPVEAYAWMNLAASVNERGAAEERERLEKEMSTEEVQRAHKRTRLLLEEQQRAQEKKGVSPTKK